MGNTCKFKNYVTVITFSHIFSAALTIVKDLFFAYPIDKKVSDIINSPLIKMKLQQKAEDLDQAYQNFFAVRANYPNFKKKHHTQVIRYPQRFKLAGNKIYLPKVGWVKIKQHRAIEGTMKKSALKLLNPSCEC